MSYAKSVLQPNEQLVMVGKLHWIIFGHAILWLFVGTILVTAENIMTSDEVRTYVVSITVVVFGIGFLITFVHAWFIRWITEFSVTDRRVIYKRGFINRHTAEMNMIKWNQWTWTNRCSAACSATAPFMCLELGRELSTCTASRIRSSCATRSLPNKIEESAWAVRGLAPGWRARGHTRGLARHDVIEPFALLLEVCQHAAFQHAAAR